MHSDTDTWTTTASVATVDELLSRLREAYPNANLALHFETPLQLLVATILLAQSTEKAVNRVTPALFARYPTVDDFANATRFELEPQIRPVAFYRQKARYIQMACEIIVRQFDRQVPTEVSELIKLPGVARKTANLVLGETADAPQGVAVDTHVKRVVHRLKLTDAQGPEAIERDLMSLLPPEAWAEFSRMLSLHGRRICHLRKPACAKCTLSDMCPSSRR